MSSDLLGHRLHRGEVDVGQHERARTLLREPQRQGTADPAARSGDHEVAVCQLHRGDTVLEVEAGFN
jgi:hypothetical protein